MTVELIRVHQDKTNYKWQVIYYVTHGVTLDVDCFVFLFILCTVCLFFGEVNLYIKQCQNLWGKTAERWAALNHDSESRSVVETEDICVERLCSACRGLKRDVNLDWTDRDVSSSWRPVIDRVPFTADRRLAAPASCPAGFNYSADQVQPIMTTRTRRIGFLERADWRPTTRDRVDRDPL